ILPVRPRELLKEGLRLNQQAEAWYDQREVPRALWEQRAELLRRLGNPEVEAKELDKRAEDVPLRTVRDEYLLASVHVFRGRYQKALPLLRSVTRQDPDNVGAWCLLGTCYLDGFARDIEAAQYYGTCTALCPDCYAAYLDRGLAYLSQRDHA